MDRLLRVLPLKGKKAQVCVHLRAQRLDRQGRLEAPSRLVESSPLDLDPAELVQDGPLVIAPRAEGQGALER